MKRRTFAMTAEVADQDADLLENISAAAAARFLGTAVTMMPVNGTLLVITESAKETLYRMQNRVFAVAGVYGLRSVEYTEMQRSFSDALMNLLGIGGTITRDGNSESLSLYGISYIHYGIIFHRRYIDGYNPDDLLGEWSFHS